MSNNSVFVFLLFLIRAAFRYLTNKYHTYEFYILFFVKILLQFVCLCNLIIKSYIDNYFANNLNKYACKQNAYMVVYRSNKFEFTEVFFEFVRGWSVTNNNFRYIALNTVVHHVLSFLSSCISTFL